MARGVMGPAAPLTRTYVRYRVDRYEERVGRFEGSRAKRDSSGAPRRNGSDALGRPLEVCPLGRMARTSSGAGFYGGCRPPN